MATIAAMFWLDGEQLIASLNTVLVRDALDMTAVHQAFRYAHSVRSQAEHLRLQEIATASEVLEDRLAAVRAGRESLTPALVQQLRKQAQQLSDVFTAVRNSGTIPEEEPGLSSVAAVTSSKSDSRLLFELLNRENTEQLLRMLRSVSEKRSLLFWIFFVLSEAPEFMRHRRYLLLQKLESATAVLVYSPIEDDPDRSLFQAVVACDCEDTLRECITGSGVQEMKIQRVTEEYIRNGIAVQSPYRPALLSRTDAVHFTATQHNYEKMLMDISRLVTEPAAGRRAVVARRVLSHLTSAGLVFVADIFSELEPLVAQLAEAQQKHVECRICRSVEKVSGAAASILRESLVHLVRNAIDHGIELPDERLEKGKAAAGNILLSSRTVADTVEISIFDDGRGLPFASSSPEADLQLLTEPGFSTGKSQGNVSGRGVGLDVVRHSVEKLLHGRLSIQSAGPRGTFTGVGFLLTIPQYPELVSVVIVRCGDGSALAVPGIYTYDRITLEQERFGKTAGGQDVYRLQNMNLPAVHNAEHVRELQEGLILHVDEERVLYCYISAIAEESVVLTTDTIYSEVLQEFVPLMREHVGSQWL